MRKFRFVLIPVILAVLLSATNAFAPPAASAGPAAPSLGSAQNFAILAGSTVTNTGDTIVTGDLGVSPGTAVTGFPPGIVNGTVHAADAVAAQAQSDVTAAYDDLAGRACDTDLTGQDLGGLTLTAGVYCFSSSAQLTGALVLDGQGDSNAVFIFKMGSTLTTASGSSVSLINGGNQCRVFWQVGSSATLGTGTAFAGNILALESITLNDGANVVGRLLARTAAVTLIGNSVSRQCWSAATATPTATVEGPTETSTPTATPTVEGPAATSTPTATATVSPAPPTATLTAAPTSAPTAAPTSAPPAPTAAPSAPTATPAPTPVALPVTGGDLQGERQSSALPSLLVGVVMLGLLLVGGGLVLRGRRINMQH